MLQVVQLVVSIRQRETLRDETGDPWDGRSLEWATPSPPPAFNFAVLPNVEGEEAYWGIKQQAHEQANLSDEPEYDEIEMPRNSPTGFICAFFATIMGFALIWHIWWLVGWRRSVRSRPSSGSPGATDGGVCIPAEEVAPHRSRQPQRPCRLLAEAAAA